jgi:hypothetical protein
MAGTSYISPMGSSAAEFLPDCKPAKFFGVLLQAKFELLVSLDTFSPAGDP